MRFRSNCARLHRRHDRRDEAFRFRPQVSLLEDRCLLSILLQDNFSGTSLDPSKWTTNTNIDRGPASVTEQNGHVELRNRGHLISTGQFDPLSVGPLEITGTWVFTQTGLPGGDFMQVLTRSDGVPDNANSGETSNGIEFLANANGNGGLLIVAIQGSIQTTLATTPMPLNPNEPYAFDIKDDGSNLSFTFTEVGGNHTSAMITATSGLQFATNHIVFHNREENNGGFSELSYLDDVIVTAQGINHPPIANDFSATTNEDRSISVSLLNHALDPDNDPLTVSRVSSASAHGGTLTQVGGGSVMYAPPSHFVGTDTFTFQVSDGSLPSNTATVTLNVLPVTQNPPIVNGIVTDTNIVQNQNIIVNIEHGQRTAVHAIVVHQTGGSTATSALSSYKSTGIGAHFLIDKDGTVYQTAPINQVTYHVGKIRARWRDEGLKPPSKADAKAKGPAAIDKLEEKKPYPVRYPSNLDAVGIELVGACVPVNKKFPKGKCIYETATPAQNVALTRLVRLLESAYGMTNVDVYRHPQVSYKTPSEAQSANWNFPGA